MGSEPDPGDGLQAQIDELVRQMTANRTDIDDLGRRADAANGRADASEARADAAEARVTAMEARAEIDRDMIADLQQDGLLSREHAAQMEEALKSSRTIGAAIGIIMESRHVSEEQAFEVLRVASQTSNRKLRDLAAELVGSAGLRHPPGGIPSASDRGGPTAHESGAAEPDRE